MIFVVSNFIGLQKVSMHASKNEWSIHVNRASTYFKMLLGGLISQKFDDKLLQTEKCIYLYSNKTVAVLTQCCCCWFGTTSRREPV